MAPLYAFPLFSVPCRGASLQDSLFGAVDVEATGKKKKIVQR